MRAGIWVGVVLALVCGCGDRQTVYGQAAETPQALLTKLQAGHYTTAKTAAGATMIVTVDETINAGSFGKGVVPGLFVSKGIMKLPQEQQVALVAYAMATPKLVGAALTEQTDAESLDKLVLAMGVSKQAVKGLLKYVQDAAVPVTKKVDVTPAPPSAIHESVAHFANVLLDDDTYDDHKGDLMTFNQGVMNRDIPALKSLAVKYPAGAADIRVIVAAMGDTSAKDTNHGVVVGSTDQMPTGMNLLAGAHAPPDAKPADLLSDYAMRIEAIGD